MADEYIASSDLNFGDVVANHCDPEFSLAVGGGADSLPSRVYRLAAYALFANRLINDINAAFSDAFRREIRFSSLTYSFVVDVLGGVSMVLSTIELGPLRHAGAGPADGAAVKPAFRRLSPPGTGPCPA